MVSTSAQRRAAHNYVEKLKGKGISQHCIYCSTVQWIILREIIKAVKNMNLDGIQSLEIDDNGRFIKFIYENAPETRVVSTNQAQDDKS